MELFLSADNLLNRGTWRQWLLGVAASHSHQGDLKTKIKFKKNPARVYIFYRPRSCRRLFSNCGHEGLIELRRWAVVILMQIHEADSLTWRLNGPTEIKDGDIFAISLSLILNNPSVEEDKWLPIYHFPRKKKKNKLSRTTTVATARNKWVCRRASGKIPSWTCRSIIMRHIIAWLTANGLFAAGWCTFLHWLWQSMKNCLIRKNFGPICEGIACFEPRKKPPQMRKRLCVLSTEHTWRCQAASVSFDCILIDHLHAFQMQIMLTGNDTSSATTLQRLPVKTFELKCTGWCGGPKMLSLRDFFLNKSADSLSYNGKCFVRLWLHLWFTASR